MSSAEICPVAHYIFCKSSIISSKVPVFNFFPVVVYTMSVVWWSGKQITQSEKRVQMMEGMNWGYEPLTSAEMNEASVDNLSINVTAKEVVYNKITISASIPCLIP